MHIALWQIILVILFGFFMNYERWVTALGLWQALMCGLITGLILGDVQTGLFVGGTLQLMTLGISSFGGASIPDYPTAAIVGTYLAIATGASGSLGITIGIPVAIVMVQLDVLNKTINIYFQHRAEKDAKEGIYSRLGLWQWCGNILTMLSTGIPILLAIVFGQKLVQRLFEIIPHWLLSGLQVAGGLLPAVGLGLLLKTMPVKAQWPALLVGFVLTAYLKVPILGVALLAVAWAFINFTNEKKKHDLEMRLSHSSLRNVSQLSNGGGIEGDE
ncbi:PTS sugar transporter subunit IIC [Sporolactobacillus shoreicorticis]|uniref:PTS mannose/fructose/sorbose/N-acetylgalactosamine transporter subunit IIC n=1 Tax=Sporolactobacillus shoreicorticis TaxID=1923877 RepID=A0ABW5S292_9BACL|nr:PTS sugar transporter subunit IIC [Sporolactobacillus shoreicorticis]MCO7124686.1 PTS sugar transporter subunit IIC [Sporolactobacillus shoreicorticis]